MPDRGKVIDRLQKVSRYFKSMMMVGYDGDSDIYREHRESVKMAIALLKEQGKSGCDGCIYKGSDNCPLDMTDERNFICPNGKLNIT